MQASDDDLVNSASNSSCCPGSYEYIDFELVNPVGRQLSGNSIDCGIIDDDDRVQNERSNYVGYCDISGMRFLSFNKQKLQDSIVTSREKVLEKRKLELLELLDKNHHQSSLETSMNNNLDSTSSGDVAGEESDYHEELSAYQLFMFDLVAKKVNLNN